MSNPSFSSQGDITKWHGDAIVNAANERMLGGLGVDGAIHKAAGPELVAECEEVPEVRPGVRCPTGEARITKGYRLPARHVIHTVGPIYRRQPPGESDRLLASAYRSCLELAQKEGLATIAFPAISCGVYAFPVPRAAEVAVQACADVVGSLREVHFVLFSEDTYDAFRNAAAKVCGTGGPAEAGEAAPEGEAAGETADATADEAVQAGLH
ncbi:hypothetical protein WJX81_000647 [Elliptochloris bilobata]|uniref:Macro domain-containing protein n=1 Tax=Elliptochloris bilobata TaxID=381761 RepID=A0AAW1RKD3_9CHLO